MKSLVIFFFSINELLNCVRLGAFAYSAYCSSEGSTVGRYDANVFDFHATGAENFFE